MTEAISTDGTMMTILFNEVTVQETNISGFFIMTINGRFLVYIYRLQRSCGKVIFSQECVKNSVHREGVSASVHTGIHTPPGRYPQADNPLGRHPTPRQTPPCVDTPPPSRRLLLRTVRILLECILVSG